MVNTRLAVYSASSLVRNSVDPALTTGRQTVSAGVGGECSLASSNGQRRHARPQTLELAAAAWVMVWGILVRRTSKVDLVTNLLPLGSCTALLRKQSLNAPHVHNLKRFSRMRSRRVPVFKVGVQGSRRRREVVAFVFAIVRNPSQSSAIVRGASDLCRTCARLAGDENRLETQNCRHFLRFVLQKCQESQGSGGSWSRNAELSSLLDSSPGLRVSKVSTVTGIGGVVETQNCRHFWTRLVFAFQKCQQSQGSGGSWSRNAELSSLLDSPLERRKERGERRKER